MQNIASLFIHSTRSAGYQNISDGKFSTEKVLVLQCLYMCDNHFFRKVWQYMDAYQHASFTSFEHAQETEIFWQKGA